MLCTELLIQKHCHCTNSINDLLLALRTSLPRCNPTNITQDLCRQVQIKRTTEEKICSCPPSCDDEIYTPLISTNQVNMRFFKLIKNTKGIYVGEDVCSLSQNNTVRLHVYLESLQQETITELPAKTIFSFIAEVGGNMGLFLGFSIASLLEIAEFFFDLLRMGGSCDCRGNRISDDQPQKMMTPVPLPKEIVTTSPNGSEMNIGLLEHDDEGGTTLRPADDALRTIDEDYTGAYYSR
ncbi:Epithelial sodium channel [Trinorchestia longiramus]|nr:Epithelial sodium channel [Trinorchestia longiramus]